MTETDNVEVIALTEETAKLEKRTIETDHVRVIVATEEEPTSIQGELYSDLVSVERAPIGQFIDVAPRIRQEGDVTIYPVVEEVLVKRLMLREEVRVTRTRKSEPYEQTVRLKHQVATVERSSLPPDRTNPRQTTGDTQ